MPARKKFTKFTIAALIVAVVVSGIFLVQRHIKYKNAIAANEQKKRNKAIPLPFTYTTPSVDSTQQGYILLTPHRRFNMRNGRIVVMDFKGRILFEKVTPGTASDFRQWIVNGQKRYTYGIDDPAAVHVTLEAGYVLLLDSALNPMKQIHLKPYNDITTDKGQDLDLHDFILLSDEHYIAMAVYPKNATNIPEVLSPSPANRTATAIIQEVNNGAVVWQWDASNYQELYTSSTARNNFHDTAVQDYIHLNSMCLDPRDSNLILSMRNLNQIIKINRKTGNIMWRLGGKNSDFHLTAEQEFLRQHNVTLTDSNQTLLVFDNGEKGKRENSRILEFRLDEQKRSVTAFRSFRIPAPFSEHEGSVQKCGNNYLISGGTGNYLLLVNPATGTKRMELNANQCNYRAYWIKDINSILR